jgi:hypothetical protein
VSAVNFPADAALRCRAVSSAVSGRPGASRRRGTTWAGLPRPTSHRAAIAASRSTCWPPRARATRAADGIGTSHSGRRSVPATSVTAPASAAPRPAARSRRPRSLYASRHVRAAPSYAAAIASGGRPTGSGSGRCRRGRLMVRPQPAHNGPSAAPQATQRLGRTRSANAEITRRRSPVGPAPERPPDRSVDNVFSVDDRLISGTRRWYYCSATPTREVFGGAVPAMDPVSPGTSEPSRRRPPAVRAPTSGLAPGRSRACRPRR